MKPDPKGFDPYNKKSLDKPQNPDIPSRTPDEFKAREKAGSSFKRGIDKVTGYASTKENDSYDS